MGYLTSGAYSLSRGRPHGIGTVALSKMVEVKKQMLAYVLQYCAHTYHDTVPQNIQLSGCGQNPKHEFKLLPVGPNHAM